MFTVWITKVELPSKQVKCGGKPCIRGLRITVYDELSYVASGMTREEILQDFPYLEAADIKARLAYAAARDLSQVLATA